MRGDIEKQTGMWSYRLAEERIPTDHPLRPIRKMIDETLARLSPRFDELYARTGRPSIPPEYLLRALLLQILFSIRSERQLMEQLDYNILYRWFVGLEMDDPVWAPTVFSKNRERLLDGDIAQAVFTDVLAQAKKHQLLSGEHFAVDGTLIKAWASQKSIRPKDEDRDDRPQGGGRNATVEWQGEQRRNETHASTTDPQARLYTKAEGKVSMLCYMGHAMTENRNGLVVATELTQASGTAEREAALTMIQRRDRKRITLAADKGYHVREFVEQLRENGVVPHIARHKGRGSAIDGRTVRHTSYKISLTKRKLVEEFFGWSKYIGQMRQTKFRGLERIGWMFTLTAAVYNLLRIRTLTYSTA
jgi:transposase